MIAAPRSSDVAGLVVVVVEDTVVDGTVTGPVVVEEAAEPSVLVVDVPVVHAAASRASAPTARKNFTRPDYGTDGCAAGFLPPV